MRTMLRLGKQGIGKAEQKLLIGVNRKEHIKMLQMSSSAQMQTNYILKEYVDCFC